MSAAEEMPGIDWNALDGALLLVTPKEAITEMETPHGPSSAVRADVAVLDGPRVGDDYQDILIFPRVLQSQVRPSIDGGGMVLGRLGVGRELPGHSAPWWLGSATEDDKAIGRLWLARRAEKQS